jgi:cytochrome P450 family 2 subfamily U polypeptide 1
VIELLPFLKYISPYHSRIQKRANQISLDIRGNVIKQYREHLKTYQPGSTRDFADALIFAKEEAEAESLESKEYLNDTNLGLTLLDLFLAGTDTTKGTMQWLILLMANFPEMQNKMREEIDEFVGDQVVIIDHKNNLNYVQAFISETLRFRPVVPLGVAHKATVDSSIGGILFKKGTTITLNHYACLHDPDKWVQPELFNPMRFIDEAGKHSSRNPSFVPFGTGRRMCLGEKLALTDLLFITCRLLQATKGFSISLPGGPGSADLTGDLKVPSNLSTRSYKIMLKRNQ